MSAEALQASVEGAHLCGTCGGKLSPPLDQLPCRRGVRLLSLGAATKTMYLLPHVNSPLSLFPGYTKVSTKHYGNEVKSAHASFHSQFKV